MDLLTIERTTGKVRAQRADDAARVPALTPILILQRVVIARPPLFDVIDAEFNVAGKPVLFSFGAVIYNPEGVDIPPWLIDHEGVHGARQLAFGDTIAWWARYILSPQFRFDEELPAHVAEYRWFLDKGNRNQRRAALSGIAHRLAGPLYGRMIPYEKARGAIKRAT